MYTILEEMPFEGHFIALWTFEGAPWSYTFKKINNIWHKFGDNREGILDWIRISHPSDHIPTTNERVDSVRYLILDEIV